MGGVPVRNDVRLQLRGECSICRLLHKVRTDGKVMTHINDPALGTCVGSGTPPLALRKAPDA